VPFDGERFGSRCDLVSKALGHVGLAPRSMHFANQRILVPAVDAKTFYDGWVDHQVSVGINDRHRAIAASVRRAGWRPTTTYSRWGAEWTR
jgi:hypothetical protein